MEPSLVGWHSDVGSVKWVAIDQLDCGELFKWSSNEELLMDTLFA